MKKKRNAFTLVELLVVVAIISVLAGLLLPVLDDAIESSRRTSCLSQEKQLYLGANFYADDWDGRLPFHWGSYGCYDKDLLYWTKTNAPLRVYLAKYCDVPISLNLYGSITGLTDIARCPSMNLPDNPARTIGYTFTGFGPLYGQSPRLSAMASGGKVTGMAAGPVALLMDSTILYAAGWWNGNNHVGEGGNIGAADGSCQWVGLDRLSTGGLGWTGSRIQFPLDYYVLSCYANYDTFCPPSGTRKSGAELQRLYGF